MKGRFFFVLPDRTICNLTQDAGIRLRLAAWAEAVSRSPGSKAVIQRWGVVPPDVDNENVYVFPFHYLRSYWWRHLPPNLRFVVDSPESVVTAEREYATSRSLRYYVARWYYRISPPDPLDLTREILSRASLIFCSSELQISAFKEINQKVVFLPDSFPVEEYQLCKIHGTTKTVTISWVGQASTAYQLAVVSDVLRELQQRYGVKILVVSGTDMGRRVRGSRTVQGLISRLGICAEVRPWRRERIAGDLVEADIGIAPIDTSRAFNLEKGAHRVQLYHIAGLPVVASSIASYRWWVRNGVDGFLCNGTSEWLQRLEELVSNWTLRAAMGTAGAARAWDRLAVETVAAECLRWLEDVGS